MRKFKLSSTGLNLAGLLCLAACLQAQPWSGIISNSRAINWANAGVSGGIPSASWTQCGSTIAAYSGSPSTINSAVAACGANQYVQLGAGTFNLNAGLLVNAQSNVAIRGMGANQTFLVFSGNNACEGYYTTVCFQSSDLNWNGGPSNGPVNWTASSYAQGTSTITVASVPNLKVGNSIILDQLDSASDNGSILESAAMTTGPFTAPGSAGPYSIQGDSGEANRAGRGESQISVVTACGGVTTPGASCAGTNVAVTIAPGLLMPNWAAASSPQAWWPTSPAKNVGVENLSIDATNAGFGGGFGSGVEFFNVVNGWAKGVRTVATSRAAVEILYSTDITVRDSYFFLATFSTSTSYGTECFDASNLLVENNIFEAIAEPLMINGSCPGAVLGYNYATMQFYTSSSGYSMPMSQSHGIATDLDLYEGNVGSVLNADNFHGTHNLDTLFRNYYAGDLPSCWISGSSYKSSTYGPCNNGIVPIALQSYSRFFNIIGNVLGTSGVQTGYQSGIPILGFGSGDTDPNSGISVPSDPTVKQTAMLWGNYDTVTGAVRWCGNSSSPGWSTTCGSASEVPTSYPFYPNAVPASTTLPASFYYSSKPSWWPSGKVWPLMGPDVTGGNIAGLGGHANTNPAEDCFLNVMGGSTTGGVGPFTFNPSSCYGTVTSSQPPQTTQVVPPLSLTAIAK